MSQFPRILSLAVLAALLPAIAPAEPFKDVFPDIYQQVPADLLPGIDALDLKSGTVKLGDGIAEVAVPQDYDFLDVPSRMITYTLVALPFSWQDRF